MPRTRLDKYAAPKRQPLDLPKALILERIVSLGVGSGEIAKALNISEATFSRRRRQPSSEWTLGEIISACVFLGIDPADLRSAIRYKV